MLRLVAADGLLGVLDRLDPPRCLFCGDAGFAHMDLCRACYQAMPDNAIPCPRCALPWSGGTCAACLTSPPAWQAAVIPFRYVPPVATLITELKYHARFMAARILGWSFCDRRDAIYPSHDMPQLLIPMPLHYSRQRQRGFNQACAIAQHVATCLGMQLAPRLLWRPGATASQVGLSGAARRRNMQDAFAARSSAVRGRQVALFDDVVTTGATAMAAATTLLDAGAARVELWAVARSQGPLTALRH